MKNLKLVMFFTVCFLFAGMQYATAQIKDKVEEVKTTTDEVKEEIKQEASKLNPEDDKRVYTTKATEAKKVETAVKLEETLEQPKGVNGEATTIKELDSDDLEEDELEGDDLDDDDN